MADVGIFHEDDRVELIDGEIVQMTPIGSRHAGCVSLVHRLLDGPTGCREHTRLGPGDKLVLSSVPGLDLSVSELLG
jgi:hypothetical protein